MTSRVKTLLAFPTILLIGLGSLLSAQDQLTIITDADSTVRVICRQDVAEEDCFEPRSDDNITDDWDDHPRYLRVHDQNALDVAYLHFDLSGVSAGAEVTNAQFQLDAQSNSWGDTTVAVVAIVDESKDWNLNDLPEGEITGETAPMADWAGWDDDPDDPRRFNSPTPFLDEGTGKGDPVRELDFGILIESQDAFTDGTPEDPGNDYGGYGCCDGPGSAGSADAGDNIWPIDNAVEVDITELVNWKLGKNPDYSSFTPSDRELTLMVRTDFSDAGGNGFARFVARESDFLGGELNLAPGRISLTGSGLGGVSPSGDFNNNGVLDLPDVNLLNAAIAAGANDPDFDLDQDGAVNASDLNVWVVDLRETWFGDANLDGEFNSGDLVSVFTAGKYEFDQDAGWDEGDWTGDLRFGSGDLVAAFAGGGFEVGPRPAAAAVPEPVSSLLLLWGAIAVLANRRRHRLGCS